MGVATIHLPSWSLVKPEDWAKLDLGRSVRPLTKQEIDNGYIARGPIVASAVPGTRDEAKKSLPVPCHDIRLFQQRGVWVLGFDTSPGVPREIRLDRTMYPSGNGIIIGTEKHGPVKFRKLLRGDRPLYSEVTISPDSSTVEEFVKDILEGWRLQ